MCAGPLFKETNYDILPIWQRVTPALALARLKTFASIIGLMFQFEAINVNC